MAYSNGEMIPPKFIFQDPGFVEKAGIYALNDFHTFVP
jgi:hypothetical protein